MISFTTFDLYTMRAMNLLLQIIKLSSATFGWFLAILLFMEKKDDMIVMLGAMILPLLILWGVVKLLQKKIFRPRIERL